MSILIVITAIGFLIASFYYKKTVYAYISIGCAVVFLISLWRDYIEESHIQKMIAKFDGYENIWCVDGAFSVKSAQVSKSDGWIRNGNYISNGDTKLHIKQCKDQL